VSGETRSERTYLATAVPCGWPAPSVRNCAHRTDLTPFTVENFNCTGCLRDGTRLDLDSLREVERKVVVGTFDVMGHERRECWVEVSSDV
jgi:hypothetical protein